MRICVISETSAADKNAHILAALKACGDHVVMNAGMTQRGVSPELTYIHTGFLSALLLNLNRVDFVVGGCGTGQGYLNAVMQYPGVFCGHILNSLDAWLFTQINGGNCISLALNQGYGWAGDINLRFIFERIFSVECGCGFPPERSESQKQSRQMLDRISTLVHLPLADIVDILPDEVTRPALEFPGIQELLDVDSIADRDLREALRKKT
jgi:ribose 5-phosphate isomerase RpiB